MVKVDEEKKSPGPNWNRRLKRLLIIEIIAALVGLALFYGYLVSRPVATLTGITIATAPQPLIPVVVERPADRQPAPLPGAGVPETEKLLPAPAAPAGETPMPRPAAGSGPEAGTTASAAVSPQSPAGSPGETVEPGAGRVTGNPPAEEPPAAVTAGQAAGAAVLPSPASPPSPSSRKVPSQAVLSESALVEVGDFILPGRLEAAVARLKQMGIPATVVERELPTPMYRVYLGPFTEGKKALAMRAVSRRLGDQPFLEKRPEGYFLIISSFYLEANVETWLQKYRQAGYQPRVMRELLPVKHSFLLVDAAATGSPVEIILERLRQAGFSKARQRGSLPAPSRN